MAGDPFDFSTSDPSAPGFMGQSPGFWRDLATFSGNLGAAANARQGNGFLTYGGGFAGPFGAAVSQTMDTGRQNALSRAALAQSGATTQSKQIENVGAASALPLTLARNQFLAGIYQDPAKIQALMNGGGVLPSSGAAQAPQGGGDYASTVMQGEGTGANPRSSAAGFGQFTDGSWNQFAQENPQYFKGMTPQQISAARTDPTLGPQLGSVATNWLAGKNAPILQAAGVQPTGQTLGMSHYLGPQAAAAVFKAPDNAQVPAILTQAIGPQEAQRYLQANPELNTATAGALRQKYAHVPTPGQMAAGGGGVGGSISGDQAMATAQQYEQRANQIELMKSLGLPVAGDPAALRQAAQQYREMGLKGPGAAAEAQAKLAYAGPTAQATAAGTAAGELPYAGPKAAAISAAELPARMAALGFRAGAGGQFEAIPGGPADPSYIGQKAAEEAAAKAQVELATAGPIAAAQAGAKAGVELKTIGPITAQKSANSNVDVRPGGMVRIQGPNGQEWVKNPQLETIQNPDGTFTYTHVTPPLPGSPPGTPGESTPVVNAAGQPAVEKIAPQTQAARTKAAEDFAGKDTDSYIAAQNTHSWLEQMDHAADTLNANQGFLNTGPTSPARMAFANTVNDILRTSGLPTAFNPNAIGAWEELKKATTTAGFELSSHYEGHARQAAQTIINATSAVPSASNSPVGFHVVSAGIHEAAQNAIDLHEYKQQIYNQGGDLNKAEVQFYRDNPAQMYARRAISTVTPYTVASDNELGRYLPGTFVQYKGKLVQVPERPGAPPIPEYLKAPQQQAPAP